MNKMLALTAIMLVSGNMAAIASDTVATTFPRPLEWRIGAGINPAWVPPTNGFLKGDNPEGKKVGGALSGDIRADFSFNPATREGLLYKGLYQGIGIGPISFFSNAPLGTPASAYVYQGAPLAHISERLWLGYEWQFGAAFGWKHHDRQTADNNAVVSTSVTARMGLGLKLHYSISNRWQMSVGIMANHYSNGNTSWPNEGVNTIGAAIGLTYTLNPQPGRDAIPDKGITGEADRGKWFYDIMAYGAWRKRAVWVGRPSEAQLCPGRFGIVGVQFSPLRRMNRWIAVGPSLDLQWDESAGLAPFGSTAPLAT